MANYHLDFNLMMGDKHLAGCLVLLVLQLFFDGEFAGQKRKSSKFG